MSELSLAYILRRNAYRDNSLLLDCFHATEGRISVVARYSRSQGGRIKGMLEPFRLLDMHWRGRGEVFTLNYAEEKRRYALRGAALIQATYINELLLRAFQQRQSIPELFAEYRRLLHDLEQGSALRQVMLYELKVLEACGYEMSLWRDDATGEVLEADRNYHFQPEHGMAPVGMAEAAAALKRPQTGVLIPGEVLIALRYPEIMETRHWQTLRIVLDRMLSLLLEGKPLYARQLLNIEGINTHE